MGKSAKHSWCVYVQNEKLDVFCSYMFTEHTEKYLTSARLF